MASVENLQVALRVFGETLEPDEVSALLGTAPSQAHRKGDAVGRSGEVSSTGSWILASELSASRDIEEQVESVLEKLTKDFDEWASLTTRYSADIACIVSMISDGADFDISPRLAQALADRGLAIGFTIQLS